MMKITYHISETADIKPGVISDRILLALDKPGYVIIRESRETIEFYDNIWRLASRTNAFGRVDGGKFEIKNENNRIVLNFSYYASPTSEILVSLFFIYLAIFKEYHAFYAVPIILIFFLLRMVNVKTTAREMVTNILAPSV
jgi:hypothetical protein